MRAVTLALLFLALGSLAGADDVFTQKPVVPPTVERGAEPAKTPAVADTGWDAKFSAGPVPLWVWGADINKTYFIRKTFDAPGVTAAKVKFTADNHVRLYLNGKLAGSCDEWQDGAEADVTTLLKDKGNEFVAEVTNDGGPAGFVLKLVTTGPKDATNYLVSDESWTAAAKKDAQGVAAKKIAKYGEQPWGNVFQTAMVQPGSKVPANTFVTLPGFKVEKLFTVPKAQLGSWFRSPPTTRADSSPAIRRRRTGPHHAGQGGHGRGDEGREDPGERHRGTGAVVAQGRTVRRVQRRSRQRAVPRHVLEE